VSSGQNLVSRPARNELPSWDVLTSSGTHWGSLTADIYDFRTPESPELRSVDPGIALHLSSPTLINLRLDGYRDTRVRVEGDLSVFSAGSCRQVQSKRPHRVLVIALHRDAVLRTIYEMKAADAFELGAHPFLRDAQIEHICHAVLAEMDCDYASGSLYWRFSFARVVLTAAKPALRDLLFAHWSAVTRTKWTLLRLISKGKEM
jgi:hypothetical protein